MFDVSIRPRVGARGKLVPRMPEGPARECFNPPPGGRPGETVEPMTSTPVHQVSIRPRVGARGKRSWRSVLRATMSFQSAPGWAPGGNRVRQEVCHPLSERFNPPPGGRPGETRVFRPHTSSPAGFQSAPGWAPGGNTTGGNVSVTLYGFQSAPGWAPGGNQILAQVKGADRGVSIRPRVGARGKQR